MTYTSGIELIRSKEVKYVFTENYKRSGAGIFAIVHYNKDGVNKNKLNKNVWNFNEFEIDEFIKPYLMNSKTFIEETQWMPLLNDRIPKFNDELNRDSSDIGVGLTFVAARRSQLTIGHIGDSRVVICTGNDKAIQLTTDHRPTVPTEIKRAAEMKTKIKKKIPYTRSLGDADLKKEYKYINADAEVLEIDLKKYNRPKFVIIGTRDIWNTISNQDAVDLVNNCFKNDYYPDIQLTNYAFKSGANDYLLSMIVRFENGEFEIPSPKAIENRLTGKTSEEIFKMRSFAYKWPIKMDWFLQRSHPTSKACFTYGRTIKRSIGLRYLFTESIAKTGIGVFGLMQMYSHEKTPIRSMLPHPARMNPKELYDSYKNMNWEKALREYMINLDKELKGQVPADVGATYTIAILKGNMLYGAHIGDCRLVICGEDAIQITNDHLIDDQKEIDRIEAMANKINQTIPYTRSLADVGLKSRHPYLGEAANVFAVNFSNVAAKSIIIASREIWNKISLSNACELVNDCYAHDTCPAEQLNNFAFYNEANDFFGSIVIRLTDEEYKCSGQNEKLESANRSPTES